MVFVSEVLAPQYLKALYLLYHLVSLLIVKALNKLDNQLSPRLIIVRSPVRVREVPPLIFLEIRTLDKNISQKLNELILSDAFRCVQLWLFDNFITIFLYSKYLLSPDNDTTTDKIPRTIQSYAINFPLLYRYKSC
jgi:hypothetical protein